MPDAYIGIGSNVGDRLTTIARAVDMLADTPGNHVKAVSSAYESEPWGGIDQPLYANAVAVVATELDPEQLLDVLHTIELELGRDPEAERNSPRPIDLDIVLFGDTEMRTDDLVIPHERASERDFVITPLLEVNPTIAWPDGSAIDRSLATEGKVLGVLGCVPDWGEQHNEPVYAGEWVAVAESEMAQSVAAGLDASLQFKREVLEQAEIPVAWDPYEPGTVQDPWGLYTVYRLLVPRDDARRAADIIAEAESAAPEMTEELEGAAPE